MSAFCIETLMVQRGLTSLMVHPRGRFFATGRVDGTANLWDCSILNTDRQFEMARMRGLEGHLIRRLIPPESMYRMRRPQKSLIDRVTGQRAGPIMLLQNPSAKTALAKENASRLAELWEEAAKPGSPKSPKTGSSKSPKAGSSKSPKAGSSKTDSPKSSKNGSSKAGSSKADKSGGGRKSRKKNLSRKVKRSASKTKHYRKFR
jgi:hypothetical protein